MWFDVLVSVLLGVLGMVRGVPVFARLVGKCMGRLFFESFRGSGVGAFSLNEVRH